MVRVAGAGRLNEGIREALGRGAGVVTANERAARAVRRGWDELEREGGRSRWEPADVLSWAAWTGSLWRQMLLEGRARSLLMNGFQEHAVWRGVLEADEEAHGLRGLDALARMAAESWARMWAYSRVPERRSGRSRVTATLLREAGAGRDTAAFARWARAFEEQCAAERLISGAELDAVLAEAVRTKALRLDGRELVLVGFDRMTPAQESLAGAVRGAGVVMSMLEVGASPEVAALVEARDGTEELRGCARWAAALLEQDRATRVAVIVPDLAGDRAAIDRVFREVLASEMEAVTAGEGELPYAFSLGRALSETPMVEVGLTLLRWASGALPLERASGVLVSEYFAGRREERYARAELDELRLRRQAMLHPEVSLGAMVRMVAGSSRAGRVPVLVGALRRMERMAERFAGLASGYGEWAREFREYLQEADWGAAGGETSEEYQIRERWESALDALSTLDFDGRSVDFAGALRALERIARETVFAVEASEAPVQVMGPLEAAGSEFDTVWLLRGGETSWPPGERVMPLLGWAVQRELGMPGTDAARDLQRTKELTERIVRSGRREVVVSYARTTGEVEQRAAAVVRGLEFAERPMEELAGAEPERAAVTMERVEEGSSGPPLAGSARVKGGVRVLELQAACGFRAFAEQRLRSRELEERALGMDARESGNAVHIALERFWSEVGSQAALKKMTAGERDEVLGRAIEEAVAKAAAAGQERWEYAYLDVQRDRLKRLLERWLEEEIQRTPEFEVVRREETMEDVEVGPLRLRFRMDRVDLVDGEQVLIDYKTGVASPSEWLGERPDRPQVPLYAIMAARSSGVAGEEQEPGLTGAPLGAVAYGVVRAGEQARLTGFTGESRLIRKPASMEGRSFAEQVARWDEVLERLAEEFAAGDARVKPKNYPATCQYCGQRMLCRVDARLLEEMEVGGEEEDSAG